MNAAATEWQACNRFYRCENMCELSTYQELLVVDKKTKLAITCIALGYTNCMYVLHGSNMAMLPRFLTSSKICTHQDDQPCSHTQIPPVRRIFQ